VPWPNLARNHWSSLFRRFRAPFDKRKTQGGSAEHGELTYGEIGAEDSPKATRGLGWRAARVELREWRYGARMVAAREHDGVEGFGTQFI
jgi:hypothetical protein